MLAILIVDDEEGVRITLKKILEKEGFPKHAFVCERHLGVGITKKEIEKRGLPLPKRDMVPVSVEEKIISFADLFFSKDKSKPHSVENIREWLSKFGDCQAKKFDDWCKLFHFHKNP